MSVVHVRNSRYLWRPSLFIACLHDLRSVTFHISSPHDHNKFLILLSSTFAWPVQHMIWIAFCRYPFGLALAMARKEPLTGTKWIWIWVLEEVGVHSLPHLCLTIFLACPDYMQRRILEDIAWRFDCDILLG